jgi:hypothetical protein
MSRHHPKLHLTVVAQALAALAVLGSSAACLASDPQPASAAAGANAPGHWVDHKYRFNSMTFTSTYSCNGLIDKLRLMLKTSGARVQKLSPMCSNGYGRPDRLAQVDVEFSTLLPESDTAASNGSVGASSSTGVWKRVQLAPNRPYDLGLGDCELVDRFRAVLLPMFAARDVQNNLRCIPHQLTTPYGLSFEVFAPAPAAAAAH